MGDELQQQIDAIDTAIAGLQAKKATIEANAALVPTWPKRITLYVHGSKEGNYDVGAELGLTGEALNQFMFTAYEVALEYEVRENGSSTLVACDGQTLQPKAGETTSGVADEL